MRKMDAGPIDRPLDTRVLHISQKGKQLIFSRTWTHQQAKKKQTRAKTSACTRAHTIYFIYTNVKVFLISFTRLSFVVSFTS